MAAAAAVAFGAATAVREIVRDDPGGGDGDTSSLRVERTGSEPAAADDAPVPSRAVPATWRIRYRVAGPGTESTEEVVVRAPFESRTEVRSGGELVEEREADLGVSASKPAAADRLVLAPRPEPAGMVPGPIVADAAEHGLLVEREVRTVAGRACRVYRTSSDLGGVTFIAPTSSEDYVDLCIGGDGLLLELLEVFEGRPIRQRVALDVEVGVEVTDGDVARLDHSQTVPANQGGGSFREIDPASQPVGPFFVLDAPPAGYALLGRYEVIPPQPDIARPDTRGRVVASVVDVYVAGGSTIVVERGGRLDQAAPWEQDERMPDVELGPSLGTGEFLAGVTGGEVRVALAKGRFVRVYGTAGLDQLLAVARALRPDSSGTGPVYR